MKETRWQSYPRPQMKREGYKILNGIWKLDGQDIFVPFAPQSRLYGFKGKVEDTFVYETLFTIQKFFENNLNVSETSRRLFVHRNTLVYRLEKIKKLTGLDLREFDHAIVFKIALMVKKYLSANPTKY